MNQYLKNLNRLEFIVTWECTGKCKHCSVGECKHGGAHLDKDIAESVVLELAKSFKLDSVMTFGGESLLYPDCVCAVHSAAEKMKIPKRQLITNGFFTKDIGKIKEVTHRLSESGVNDILLSVDAFHQETIPANIVSLFACEVLEAKLPVRLSPAWLVSKEHDNPYNRYTHEILEEFKKMGIPESFGNIVFPEGNAKIYLKEYFDGDNAPVNPYVENPEDVKSISVEPDGSIFGRNVYKKNIIEILDGYKP